MNKPGALKMRPDDDRRVQGHSLRRRIAQVGIAALLLAGCGAELYEERLVATRGMFAHQDQLNQNLSGAWGDSATGVSLRVPTQFVMLPPPEKPAPDPAAEATKAADATSKKAGAKGEEMEEEGEEEVIDDRQPSYINIGLPGLRGAFRASLKYTTDRNGVADGDGFLYVLTNHHLADQPDQARDFEKNVIQVLSEALHVEVDKWNDDRFPPEAKAKASFVKSLAYRDVIITSGEEISGYVREFSAYMFDQGDIQVVVLFVLPKDVDSAEKISERIPLCLETLLVSGDKLTPPTAGAAPVVGTGKSGF